MCTFAGKREFLSLSSNWEPFPMVECVIMLMGNVGCLRDHRKESGDNSIEPGQKCSYSIKAVRK